MKRVIYSKTQCPTSVVSCPSEPLNNMEAVWYCGTNLTSLQHLKRFSKIHLWNDESQKEIVKSMMSIGFYPETSSSFTNQKGCRVILESRQHKNCCGCDTIAIEGTDPPFEVVRMKCSNKLCLLLLFTLPSITNQDGVLYNLAKNSLLREQFHTYIFVSQKEDSYVFKSWSAFWEFLQQACQ